MSMLTGLVALLQNEPSIQSLVGTRIMPVQLVENSPLPALTYRVIGGMPRPTLETSGMQRVRIEFSCFGKVFADADGLREALRVFLNGYFGLLSDGTRLANVNLIQSQDFFDEAPRQYRCMVEFYFYFDFQS